ncbi:MAG: peptide deformylase [Marinifilaceae bacterium]
MKRRIFLVLMISVIVVLGYYKGESRNIEENSTTLSYRLLNVNDVKDSVRLRRKSEPYTMSELSAQPFLSLQKQLMQQVMDKTDGGVGIAAPQIGVNRCVIIVQRFDKNAEPFEVYVNPKVEYLSAEKQVNREGCMSLPDYYAKVTRAEQIRISYVNVHTKKRVVEEVSGFTAAIFQHEIDHLNGELISDK